jgi:hypothetical protein
MAVHGVRKSDGVVSEIIRGSSEQQAILRGIYLVFSKIGVRHAHIPRRR